MLNQKSFLQIVVDTFNQKRASLIGSRSDLQEVDDEYGLIHSRLENLAEDQPLSSGQEDDLREFLIAIANQKHYKFQSSLLAKLTRDVCVETGIITANKNKLR